MTNRSSSPNGGPTHPSQTLRVDEMEQRDSMVSYGAEKGTKAAWGRLAVLLRRA